MRGNHAKTPAEASEITFFLVLKPGSVIRLFKTRAKRVVEFLLLGVAECPKMRYEIIGPRGGKTGKEVTSVKGKPLPPPEKPKITYKLVDPTKHHRRG